MYKILIIEDDEIICNELYKLLKNAEYDPVILTDFKNAKEEALKINPDLILLDINIPYLNGHLLLQNIKKERDIPVIMVTSLSSESDEVLSMMYGADDYITKPYNPNILLLRIGNIFKRIKGYTDIIKYKNLIIDIPKGIIKCEDKEIPLTKNEMIIFSYLLNHLGKIVTRDDLMTILWDNNEYINDNALTVNISRLRGKLKELGLEDNLKTRKGFGYELK